MELRTLRYFLALAREGSLSHAAQTLHITVPTLSRQLSALEDEVGHALYERSSRGVVLTERGARLANYAEDFAALEERMLADITSLEKSISGTVHIAVGETKVVGLLAQAMKRTKAKYSGVDFALHCGRTADLWQRLIDGSFDFMLECEMRSHVKMKTLLLPELDTWGILVRKDDPLVGLKSISPKDLRGRSVIASRQAFATDPLKTWLGGWRDNMKVVASYNIPQPARYLVEQGFGVLFTYEDVFETSAGGKLAFVPLEGCGRSMQGLVWRRTRPAKHAQIFLDELKAVVAEYEHGHAQNE